MYVKIFCSDFILVLIISAYNLTYATSALYGDLNGDGFINSFDMVLMNRHIIEEIS